MKLTIEEVKHRVAQSEAELRDWKLAAEEHDRMWALDAGFETTWRQSVIDQGKEQVVTPDPFNSVNLGLRLIATEPKVIVPPRTATIKDEDIANKMERWFRAAWQQANHSQRRNIIYDAAWYALVRGAFCFEVKWIEDELPKRLKGKRFPIMIRALDPYYVGVKQGPLYTEWAYHKYRTDRAEARNLYPDLNIWNRPSYPVRTENEDESVEITDFWYTDQKTGDVWHCIKVDDEFAKEPVKTDYPEIPLILGYGDTSPSANEKTRRLSLLHPLNGPWQYKCRMLSSMGTGMMFSTFPYFYIINDQGMEIPNVEVRPAATDIFPAGTRVEQVMPQINMQGLMSLVSQVEQGIQQSTFPPVMYGDAGSMQAGYGVQALQASAQNRTQSTREYLEMTITIVNSLLLQLVEIFASKKGVEVYGYSKVQAEAYSEIITPKEIKGYYRNIVTLDPNIPNDDVGKQTMINTMVQSGIISRRTARELTSFVDIPSDELDRIRSERVEDTPGITERLDLASLIISRPDGWEDLVRGTSLEKAARDMGIWPEPEPPPPPPMMPPPEGVEGGPPPPVGPDGMPFIPPQGGGIPPALQGMPQPNDFGLPPQGQDLLFQQALGRDMPPAELMERMR